MKRQTPRLAFTPSPPVRVILNRLSKLTGKARSQLVSDMLDAVAPTFAEQVEMMQRIADTPDRAADFVREMGLQGITTISQQLLDLPPPIKRGRPRKNASP